MNLIGQNCVTGNIYKHLLNEPFGNPFIWTVIDYNSMINLITCWNHINFTKFKMQSDSMFNFSIMIDDLVKVQYVHYKFDPSATTLKYDSKIGDIYYHKIWEYIVQKYIDRVNRMIDSRTPPMFCIANCQTIFNDAIYSQAELQQLASFENVHILYGYESKSPIITARAFYDTYLAFK